MNIIGIDVGTSTICGVLYDPDTGKTISVTKANDTWIESSAPWERAQDANKILSIIRQIVDELNTPQNNVSGIGFTGQMHGIVYLDREGCAVSPLYTWQDGRGDLEYKDGKSYAKWMSDTTGREVSAGYGLCTHFYNQQNGLVPATACKICTIMDYAAMCVANVTTPVIDPSNAASLGMYDMRQQKFDEQCLDLLGISSTWLPAVACKVTKLGCLGNIPVYTAIGDNQAAFIGAMKGLRDGVFITIGTSAQMSVWTEEYIKLPSLETRPLPGGGYILVGAALCGGSVLVTLKDFITDIVQELTSVKIGCATVYNFMNRIAAQASNSDLQVDTRFSGSREEPCIKGSVTGITMQNFKIENIAKAFFQGIAQEMLCFYEKVPSRLRIGNKHIVGTGNALKKNSQLQLILQQLFGYDLSLSDCDEDAALGAAVSIYI